MNIINSHPSRKMTELANKYRNTHFESSSHTTPEFKLFASRFKKALVGSLASERKLVGFNRGHFYVSGFLFDEVTNQYAYFMTSDVRYFSDWHTNIVVRTAKHEKDYTGGTNNLTTLESLPVALMAIAEKAQ